MEPTAAVKKRISTRDLVYVAVFTALMAICAWIAIPTSVPFTLQTLGVFLAVGLLGGRRGTLAVLVYLLLGAVGAPMFSGFTGGIGALVGTTGGYILGFLLSALLMWALEAALGRELWVFALSMVLGLIVCYAFGTAWFMVQMGCTLSYALGVCVVPFIPFDLLKVVISSGVGSVLRSRLIQAGLLNRDL